MPKPALDLRDVKTLPGIMHIGPNDIFVSDVIATAYLESHPPVVSSPRDASGWREPTAWHHETVMFNGISGDASWEDYYPSLGGWVPCSTSNGLPLAGHPFPDYFPMDEPIGGLEQRALTSALNKLLQGDLNIGVFLAEFKQTVQLITNSIRKIAAQVKRWRRRHSRKAWRDVQRSCRTCKASNSWLELQYGWKPLLADILAALERLNASWFEIGLVLNTRSSVTDSTDGTRSFGLLSLQGLTSSDPVVLNYIVEHRCTVSLWFELQNARVAALSSLGLTNPALIVWEKVKYSFVIDWFLPIGDWLSSFSADQGWKFKSGTRSYQRVSSCSVARQGRYLSSGSARDVSRLGTSIGENFYSIYDRVVYPQRPVPGFYFKNPLSATHIASAIALLVQAFK